MPVDNPTMSFRLYRPTEFNVNLELLTRTSKELEPTESVLRKHFNYFKPIGCYSMSNDGLNVSVTKEFEKEYDHLKMKGLLESDIPTRRFSTRENGVLATFSVDTLKVVLDVFKTPFDSGLDLENDIYDPLGVSRDRHLFSNGLKLDILMSMEGYPQVFLDDEYNVRGPIGAYIKDGHKMKIHPIVEFKPLFDKFEKMGLLTVYNII